MKKSLKPVLDPSLSSLPLLPELGRLRWRTKFAYGMGHVLNDLCASMWFTYLLVYFHLVLDFSNSLSGIVLLIGQIADGLSTPFVGFESDRLDGFWLFKYGRRKTWHLIGTICVLASFPFLFMKCIGCENSHDWAQLVYYASFVVIFQFGWAAVQVSHLSLIPDLSDDTHERTELNAIRYAFTVMSNICVYLITWVVLGIGNTEGSNKTIGPDDLLKFQHIVLIVVSIGAVFSLIFHLGVKEPAVELHHTFSVNDCLTVSERVRMNWKDWLKEYQFYQIAILYMCTRLFVNLSQVYIPLFLQDTLKLQESSIAIIPLVMFVSGFVSTFFIKFMTKRAGKKFTYLIGGLIGITACAWIYLGEGESFRQVHLYIVSVLLGVGGSTILVTSLAITNDLIGSNTSAADSILSKFDCTVTIFSPEQESSAFVFGVMGLWDKIANGLVIESSAFVFGAMSFTDKFSNGFAVLLIQYFHPCATCCEMCAMYYHYVLSLGCGCAAVLALFALASIAPYEIGKRKKDLITAVEDEEQRNPLLNSTASSSSYTNENGNLPAIKYT
uniref:Major facilitator superfamily associated domain-containing protein n=1 Tax=Strigamia maritima TaxID=126957 RepID=T1JDD2_STRMM